MLNIVDPIQVGDPRASVETRITDLVEYWLGSGATSNVETWGDMRDLLNSIPGPTISNLDRGDIVRAALAAKNQSPLGPDSGFSLDFAKDLSFIRSAAGVVQDNAASLIEFQRLSGGGRWNHLGQYEWVGNNVPRYDHDPVTREPRGLLIEPAATRYSLYPTDIGSSGWAKVGGFSVSPVPDNRFGQVWLVTNATGVNSALYQGNVSASFEGSPACLNYIIKAHPDWAGDVQLINFSNQSTGHRAILANPTTGTISALQPGNGTIYASGVELLSDGFYHFWFSHDNVVEAFKQMRLRDNDTNIKNVCYVAAMWCEQGERPTSLILGDPATQVTRAADTVSVPLSELPFNQGEGTLLVEADYLQPPVNVTTNIAGLRDITTTSNHLVAVELSRGSVESHIRFGGRDAGGIKMTPIGSFTLGSRLRVAVAYREDGYSASANGGAAVDAAGLADITPTVFEIGQRRTSSTGNAATARFGNPISKTILLPRALSNAELQAWSAL